jgi:hypothetical protein
MKIFVGGGRVLLVKLLYEPYSYVVFVLLLLIESFSKKG